ncbi:MAG: MbcA/ParS/Xre antitoxin family protein [Devosiaceae bacterium]|nr:MbcA/ParS/Xre antitoxin family protein [Devosiaceae bacterium]
MVALAQKKISSEASPNASLKNSDDRRHLSGPALRTFFNIADKWNLNADQQIKLLGVGARSTFYKWKKDGDVALPRDTLERISYILGIYKSLQVLLPSKAAHEWIKKSNDAKIFGGRSALERMLSGNVADLYVVRQYLDAQRGGWA